MAVNRGKHFENLIKESFMAVRDTLVIRIPDQTYGYAGGSNICDFIIYHRPYAYCIECKTIHGNTLPFQNISKNQWDGLLEAEKHDGVVAGVICWWIDRGITKFVPITALQRVKEAGKYKSYNYAWEDPAGGVIELTGRKKRIFFEYNMAEFFKTIERTKL